MVEKLKKMYGVSYLTCDNALQPWVKTTSRFSHIQQLTQMSAAHICPNNHRPCQRRVAEEVYPNHGWTFWNSSRGGKQTTSVLQGKLLPNAYTLQFFRPDSGKMRIFWFGINLSTYILELTENTKFDTLCCSGGFTNTSSLTLTYCIPLDSPDLGGRPFSCLSSMGPGAVIL